MKRWIVASSLALVWLFFGFGAVAQAKPNFSGTWALDRERSDLRRHADAEPAAKGDEGKAEPAAGAEDAKQADLDKKKQPAGGDGEGAAEASLDMTLEVAQTDAQLKVTRSLGEGGQQRSISSTFDLSGKETDETGPRGAAVVSTAAWDADKLVLTTTRTRKMREREMKIEQKQVWSLSSDGKTLSIETTMKGPRREQTRKMVFTKSVAKAKAVPKSDPKAGGKAEKKTGQGS
jgi:hypothetical protein